MSPEERAATRNVSERVVSRQVSRWPTVADSTAGSITNRPYAKNGMPPRRHPVWLCERERSGYWRKVAAVGIGFAIAMPVLRKKIVPRLSVANER